MSRDFIFFSLLWEMRIYWDSDWGELIWRIGNFVCALRIEFVEIVDIVRNVIYVS